VDAAFRKGSSQRRGEDSAGVKGVRTGGEIFGKERNVKTGMNGLEAGVTVKMANETEDLVLECLERTEVGFGNGKPMHTQG